YNLATYSGAVAGNVEGSLTLNGGVIASATGAIDATIGRDLNIGWNSANSSLGAIVTTGELSGGQTTNYAAYSNGGSLSLNVGGNINSQVIPTMGWLGETTTTTGSRSNRKTTYTIYPNYVNPQGILAMG